ncbi:hypothetical protein PQX77_014998 [Marasmius sp. AFHP31]|nr:hypothetical protein PQX77_017792 [Marasmius sp. AFHP31]KAK1222178.1 hypothetical protein PQX77_014998 [Marasmius sp. AFHP31]
MQFKAALIALAACVAAVQAASTPNLGRRVENPANLINCPPAGNADACNLEKGCDKPRIRINYGSPQGGHYIWYNYDTNNIPKGVEVGTEAGCTDY